MLRAMALLEAVQQFVDSQQLSDRIGAGRSYLALADLFAALDRLLLEAESAYLDSLGDEAGAAQRARRGFVRLRQGEVERAGIEFDGPAPQGFEFLWGLGRAGVAALGGRESEAREWAESSSPSADEVAPTLASVCCDAWGLVCSYEAVGPYGRALRAFGRGDLAGGIMALQMLDFTSSGWGPDPDLFLYRLLRRGFAALALGAAGDAVSGEEAFLAARASDHLGDYEGAAERYRRVGVSQTNEADAAWIFSSYHGRDEAAQVAEILCGAALFRAGREAEALAVWRRSVAAEDLGTVARATLAALQGELGVNEPLESPDRAIEASLAAVRDAPGAFPAGETAELLASIYPVRLAAVSRLAARVYERRGEVQKAVEVMERAHRKSEGYRPDFINPPAFLVDFARARMEAGEYASAVAVMFELARERPSTRPAYESLKRLYASRAGGEVPPR
jgi:tetratricopeptide (TPR) repeat protein